MEQHNLGLTELEATSLSYIAQDAFFKRSMVHHSLCLSSQGGSNHLPPRGDSFQYRFSAMEIIILVVITAKECTLIFT